MNSFCVLFDSAIGNSISTTYTKFLISCFPYLYLFDKENFIKEKKYNPCISSCLVVAPSSSFDYDLYYEGYKFNISVHNSTLQSISFNNLNNSDIKFNEEKISLFEFIKKYEKKVLQI